ncbi:unnamed protein product, partial [Amoebophrya sp. A25]
EQQVREGGREEVDEEAGPPLYRRADEETARLIVSSVDAKEDLQKSKLGTAEALIRELHKFGYVGESQNARAAYHNASRSGREILDHFIREISDSNPLVRDIVNRIINEDFVSVRIIGTEDDDDEVEDELPGEV